MQFGYKKETKFQFSEAVAKIRVELASAGFGVITEIDARETFKKKLGKDFGNYIILGACHPETAYRVLEIEKDMGLMLPCNVVVYEENGKIFVSAILPTIALGMAGNQDLESLANEIEQKLKKVVDLM